MNIPVAYFEITNICNLNCQTCYNRSGLNKERCEISLFQLRQSIDLLLPLGLRRILLSGGEPTLHTEFDSILDYIAELLKEHSWLSFGIVTNGTIHTPKLIEMLNSNERFTLQISLDGSREEQNAKTRGSGNFEKAIDFVKMIDKSTHKTDLKIPYKPLLKMVISQNNIDDVENFYRLAVLLGFVPEFAFIYKSGNGEDEWENKALTAQQKLNVLQLIDRLNNELNVTALLPYCTDRCPYVDSADDMSVCIKVDGSIQPCQSLYGSEYSLGNIFDIDLVIFEQKVNEFIDLAKKRTRCVYGCNRCFLSETCGKGCLAEAVNLHDNPLGDDGGCEFRKLQVLADIIMQREG